MHVISKNALFVLFSLSLSAPFAWATPLTFSVDGVITKPDSTPLQDSSVTFYVDVVSPNAATCLLYREAFTVNMTGSNGYFSIPVGLGTNIASTYTLDKVFGNTTTMTSLTCTGGGTSYTPAAGDSRNVVISFIDSTGTHSLPSQALQSVPFALQANVASAVDTYGASQLLKVDPSVSQTTNPNSALVQAQYDEFWKLLAGTSTNYLGSSTAFSGDVTGASNALQLAKIQGIPVSASSPASGQALIYNGSSWAPANVASGGVTSIAAGTGLTGGTITSTGTMAVNVGTGAGQIVQITATGKLPAVDGSALTNVNATQLGGAAVATTGMSANQVLTYNGTSWVNATPAATLPGLASMNVWVGSSSGVPTAVALTGDVSSVSNSGVVTLNKTQTAGASQILQLTSSSVAVTKGVDVGGAGSGVFSLRYPNTSTSLTLNLPSTAGAANQYLQSDGAGDLVWGSPSASLPALANNDIWIGNASGVPTAVSMGGDASISSTGTVTLKNTGTAGTYGSGSLVPVITTDAQGRVTNVTTTAAVDATKLPLAGGSVTGAITHAANTGDAYTAGSGANTATIEGPTGAIGTSYALRLPTGLATVTGQVLTSDTTGNLSWTTPSTVATSYSGILPIANGGTNSSATLSNNKVMVSSGGAVVEGPALTNGQVLVGTTGAVPVAATLSGDISSVTSAGVVTVNKSTTGAANSILALNGSSIGTMSGLALVNSGTVTLSAGTASATYGLTLPSAAPTAGQAMMSNAAGNLSWYTPMSTGLTSGQIFVGNASNIATAVAMSGDATLSSTGAVTLKNTGAAGTYGSSTQVPIVTTDAQGRVTSVSMVAPSDTTKLPLAGGTMTGAVTYPANMGTVFTAGSGTNTVTVEGPSGVIGTSYALRLPSSVASTTGQVLSSDTAGNLSWSTVSASLPSLANNSIWVGNATGFATVVTVTGDASLSNTGALTLATVGTPGTYSKVITDAKGRVTSGSALASTDITTALSYTPLNKAGDVMTGALGLESVSVDPSGLVTADAGKMWYSSASNQIKYWNGSAAQTLGVAGAGITSITAGSGLTGGTITTSGTLAVNSTTTGTSNAIMALNGSGVANSYGVGLLGSVSGTLSLQTAATTTSYGLTFPPAQGASGQTLSNNGAGSLTWVTPTDATKLPLAGGIMTGAVTYPANTGTVFTAGSGANTVIIEGPSGIIGNSYVLRLPSAVASLAGQVLTSDATGNLSWTTPSTIATGYTGTLPVANGGTGSSTALTNNKVMVSSGGNIVEGPALTNGQVLLGVTSAAPAATTLSGDISSITSAGVVAVNKTTTGTANTILALNGSSIGTMSGLALVNSGTVTLSAGTTSATYGLTLPTVAPTAGQAMMSSSGGAFSWYTPMTSTLNSAQMWVGNSSNIATAVSMAGDASLSNTGTITLKNTGTSGTYGAAASVPIITTDAQGRVTNVTTAAPLDVTKLPLAGGTMSGSIAMGTYNITGLTSIVGNTALTVASAGTNQPLTLSSSGTGSIKMATGNGAGLMVVDPGATSVNYIAVQGAATGGSPVIAAAGSDSNINLTLSPKGVGNVLVPAAYFVGIANTSPAFSLDVGTSGSSQTAGNFTSGSNIAANFSSAAPNLPAIAAVNSNTNGFAGQFQNLGTSPVVGITAGYLNIAAKFLGHLVSGGNVPGLTNCPSSTFTGTDTRGTIVLSTSLSGTTACTVNFSSAFATAPTCVVSWYSPSLSYVPSSTLGSSTTTTALNIYFSGSVSAGAGFNYICIQ